MRSGAIRIEEFQHVMSRARSVANRRIVKSDASVAADQHERRKDFLGVAEMTSLLKSARKSRHGIRDRLLIYTRVAASRFDGLWGAN